MNVDSLNVPTETTQAAAGEPFALPMELLAHVAGGLPYNGLSIAGPVVSSDASETTDLPYNGL